MDEGGSECVLFDGTNPENMMKLVKLDCRLTEDIILEYTLDVGFEILN
jgi:hypothetical protein